MADRDATLTEPERLLLRRVRVAVGRFVAGPEGAVESFRDGYRSGGGGGFEYQFTKTGITGTWHEFIADAWHADGQPYRWRDGDLIREVTVTYRRLQRWVESLPAEVRAQALTWWRTSPENTRDLAALDGLVHELLADPVRPADSEPADLLELLEMTNA